MKISRAKAPGRGVAYFGLLLGLAISVTGNVANTLLTETTVSAWLRVPMAITWPVMTWVAIEVLTRIVWARSFAHVATRIFLAGPVALVAAFVSYLHLHHLMVLSGEPGLAQAVGPLAIDGTLFGCTVALLVTRAQERRDGADGPRRTLAERVAAARSSVDATLNALKVPAVRGTDIGATPAPALLGVELGPEVPPVLTSDLDGPKVIRVPSQRGSWDMEKAVRMLLDGEKDQTVSDAVGVGVKTVQRTRRAVSALRQDPRAEVPAEWKVPAAVVEVIRREVPKW